MTEEGDPGPSQRKLCGYERTKITQALEAISNGLPVRAASKIFGVPRTTLQDRLAGRIDVDAFGSGRPSVLNPSEEETLVQWLIQLAKCGFPRKKTDLINSVCKIMKAENRKNPFKNDTPGQKWYESFMKRHPELSQRTPEGINTARAIVTEEYIRKWFSDFLDFLIETNNLDILEDPNRILNGDETSFQICPKTGKVIGPKGWKNIYEVKRGSEKETITVMIVISAAGELVAPMVVFPYIKKPPKEVVLSVPPTIILGISESGWMRGDLFYEYIANGVNAWLEEKKVKKPVVLFVDGHKSHLTYQLSEFCDANQIILYALPPNTTHILQPADVSVFRPFKSEWRKTIKAWQDEQGKALTKVTFCPLLQKVLDKDMSQTIKNGFERCGLYPFNPNAVDYSKCVKNALENMEINETPTMPSSQDIETTLTVLIYFCNQLKEKGIVIDIEKLKKSLNELISTATEKRAIQSRQFDKYQNKITSSQSSEEVLVIDFPEHDTNAFAVSQDTDEKIDHQDNEIPLIVIPAPENQIAESSAPIVIPKNPNEEKILLSSNHFNNSPERPDTPDLHFEEVITTALLHNDITDKIKPLPSESQKKTLPISKSLVLKTADVDFDAIEVVESETIEKMDCDAQSLLSLPDSFVEEVEIPKNITFETTILSSLRVGSSPLSSRNNSGNSSPLNRKFTPTSSKIPGSSSKHTISPTFRKHLFSPRALSFGRPRTVGGEIMPLAISSPKWREYYENKENIKQEKLQKTQARKKLMAAKKEARAKTKLSIQKKREATQKRTRKNKKIKKHITCAGCEEVLVSDVEDDNLKNIGCDRCPKWFHLQCTTKKGLQYSDVAANEFICHHCILMDLD